MTKGRHLLPFLIAAFLPASQAAADGEEDFQFFAEEGRVVTVSHRPKSLRESPSTVYVVTSQDIRDSGAQNVWDALRKVPGVEVSAYRTAWGQVSVRGLNEPLSKRILVLLDGKTVLNDYFAIAAFEEIPISLEEIDRIEVVEGPASALYGPNAITGVINIITKPPEKLQGGETAYTGGEHGFHRGSALYGERRGGLAFKLGLASQTQDSFEDAGRLAFKGNKLHAQAGYDLSKDARLSVSGGLSDRQIEASIGRLGIAQNAGLSSFLRADFACRETTLRGFWNHSRAILSGFVPSTGLDFDVYDLRLEHSLALPADNNLTVGGAVKRTSASSGIFPPGLFSQNLWSLYLENQWKPVEAWTFVASARLDHHPFTKTQVSPQGTLIYSPVPEHVVRATVGTAFRNPTLVENYLHLVANSAAPASLAPSTRVETTLLGDQGLKSEKLEEYELSHRGNFGRVRTAVTAFYYKIRNLIPNGGTLLARTCAGAGCVPTLTLNNTYKNEEEPLQAGGGELAVDAQLSDRLSGFANYSYAQAKSLSVFYVQDSPKHKANAGLRYKTRGLTANLWAHIVGTSARIQDSTISSVINYVRLPPYGLVNAHAHYAFSGALKGLEIGISAFNLLNQSHFQGLPSQGPGFPGESAESIRGRWTASVSYQF